jgi:sigma-E factor negative regulatory protein RseA
MNAIPYPSQLTDDAPASALSALMDGELSPHELDALMLQLAETPADQMPWNQYHLIGDALRGSSSLVAKRSPEAFLAGIRSQLQTPGADEAALFKTVRPTLPTLSTQTTLGASPAANDAVFRWKMVAGLASLMAVMVVSWTLLDSSPGAWGGSEDRAQIAAKSAAEANSAGGGSPAVRLQPVVVDTPQGPVLRDPQLEQLMAQHRQYGDMSALHKTSGFLRSATYDAPSR